MQCVISHWGAGYGVDLLQTVGPSKRSRYSNTSSPIIGFHGDKDHEIPIGEG